jgi:hypothetical protein
MTQQITNVAAAERIPIPWLQLRLRWWSMQRQLLDRSGSTLVDTLDTLIGIPSAPQTALLALAARIPGIEPITLTTLEAQQAIVCLPTLRNTTHMHSTARATLVQAALDRSDPDLIEVARAYLYRYGPARISDFVWWTGVALERAQQAFLALQLTSLEHGYLILSEDLRAFANIRAVHTNRVTLLPPGDCYTMGYAPDGRQRFVAAEYTSQLYDANGKSHGAVLLDGEVIAVWHMHSTTLQVTPFAPLNPQVHAQIDEQVLQVQRLLAGQ